MNLYTAPRFFGIIAVASLAWLSPFDVSRADVILTAAAAPGTDLSQIRVGDTFTIDVFASSSDVGEVAQTSVAEVGFVDTLVLVDNVSFAQSAFGTDLSTDPLFIIATFTALLPGAEAIEADAANVVRTSPTMFVQTNLNTFHPISNELDFNIGPVPGPIAGAGLPGLIFAGGALLGWARTRRRRVSARLPH